MEREIKEFDVKKGVITPREQEAIDKQNAEVIKRFESENKSLGFIKDVGKVPTPINEASAQSQRDSIKLMKMSKGYQWEIRIFEDFILEKDIDRLERLNNKMKDKFEEKPKED